MEKLSPGTRAAGSGIWVSVVHRRMPSMACALTIRMVRQNPFPADWRHAQPEPIFGVATSASSAGCAVSPAAPLQAKHTVHS